jgi:3-deoxy-D-manno-octulosonic-acid transferase
MLLIYRLLINIVIVLSPIIILIRLIKKKEHPKRFKEKFCFFSKKRGPGKIIWFHGASVGELLSVIPLVKKLEKHKNINRILITSTTLSSANVFSKFKFKKTSHQFFPIDSNFLTKKFLNYWRPSIAIFIDSEIWPNMLNNLKKKSIKHILLNARLTKKSYRRWKFISFYSKKLFSNFNAVYPQNIETKNYLYKLGAKNIIEIGNLKFSENESKVNFISKNKIKELSKRKELWCASSTHNFEEIICAEAHKNLKHKYNNLLTIIIPRHIHRVKEITLSIKKIGLNVHCHSSNKKIQRNTDIYLVDTFGETKDFFKISKIVFLGGSIIKHGGQNPLEAVRFGCKILHGKHTKNFHDIYTLLKKNKQSTQVNSYKQISSSIEKIFKTRNYSTIFVNKIIKMGDEVLLKAQKEIINLIK